MKIILLPLTNVSHILSVSKYMYQICSNDDFDFGLKFTQVRDSGSHGPLVSVVVLRHMYHKSSLQM